MRPGNIVRVRPNSVVGIKSSVTESATPYSLIPAGALCLVIASQMGSHIMVLTSTGQLGWVLKYYFDIVVS